VNTNHGTSDEYCPFASQLRTELLRPIVCQSLRRVGGPHDGGYVVPTEAIARASVLLSFGLDMDWSFERGATALNSNLRVEIYDHTVRRAMFKSRALRSTISAPLRLLSLSLSGARSSWQRAAHARDYLRFFSGIHRHHEQRIWYNRDDDSAAIADVIDATASGLPLSIFAKIDVEGTEYRLIPAICQRAHRFTGLVIEFHNTDICAEIFNSQMAALREHFEVVHVHGNNYGGLNHARTLPLSIEVSFLSKALVSGTPALYRGGLPRRGLDAPNDPSRPDYVLPFGAEA
jgi:hypothetical protein